MANAVIDAALSNALAGRYVVERELGAGGMATVYLANDLRHDRRVAVKVLRPELAAMLGGERFLQEIKTTANLQHPHILGLIDSGESEGMLWYVMPYVEGETLRTRLTQEKQLPVEDALRIAREVAGALDYAHRHGVIHRDIKPENILLHDGQALVADFGIALAVTAAGDGRMTATGMSLGTPQYMSPEQAMGEKELTLRSDIYALGAVTYEMLVGAPPFTGPTVQAIMGKVLTGEPESISAQRRSVPAHVDAAVLTALEKLPADRFGSASEFIAALDNRSFAMRVQTATSPGRFVGAGVKARRELILALVAATAIIFAVATWMRGSRGTEEIARYPLAFPRDQLLSADYAGTLSISADGRRLVYYSAAPAFILRDRSRLEGEVIVGGENASTLMLSPDGESVVMSTGSPGDIQRMSVTGGSPKTLFADSGMYNVLTWGRDDWIYFTAMSGSLYRIRPSGEGLQLLVQPDTARGQRLIYGASPLPGSKAAIVALQQPGKGGLDVALADFATGTVTPLVKGLSGQYVAEAKQVLYADADGRLFAAPLDLERRALVGSPRSLDIQVAPSLDGGAQFAVSASGTLIYVTASNVAQRRALWIGRDGSEHAVDTSWTTPISSFALSPDGTRLAVSLLLRGTQDISVKALDHGPTSMLTHTGSWSYRPQWSRDGKSITYVSDVQGGQALFSVRADGSASPRMIARVRSTIDEGFYSWDGEWIILRVGSGGRRDIVAMHAGDTSIVPLLTSPAEEYSPALSPDGKWLAYVSEESGHAEVYVRPFPNTDAARHQISISGGREPLWSANGGELFYRSAGGDIVASAVSTQSGFAVLSQTKLFSTRAYLSEGYHTTYGISPDGKRFLFVQTGEQMGAQLVMVDHWLPQLRGTRAKP